MLLERIPQNLSLTLGTQRGVSHLNDINTSVESGGFANPTHVFLVDVDAAMWRRWGAGNKNRQVPSVDLVGKVDLVTACH